MKDWGEAPVFGVPTEGQRYMVRPSAYGLIEDGHGQLAVARTPQGFTLPGGGIEDGETPAQAAAREALEECGLIVRTGLWAIRAVQFTYSESDRAHYEKWSTFLDAVVEAVAHSGTEADHELVWVTPGTAIETLASGSHRWAVESWRHLNPASRR
jgi:8-oxo-dGTP diphosphatase